MHASYFWKALLEVVERQFFFIAPSASLLTAYFFWSSLSFPSSFFFAPLHLSLFHFFFDVDGRSLGCSRSFFIYNNDVVLQRNDNRFGSMPACCSRSRSPDPPHWDWLPNHWHNNLNYSSEKSLNSQYNKWTQIFAHTIASIDIAMHTDNKDTYFRWMTM